MKLLCFKDENMLLCWRERVAEVAEAAEALELVPPNAVDRYGEGDAVVKLSVSGTTDADRLGRG